MSEEFAFKFWINTLRVDPTMVQQIHRLQSMVLRLSITFNLTLLYNHYKSIVFWIPNWVSVKKLRLQNCGGTANFFGN